eukprot:gnl/MRDRNA2_/MRDRNA2_57359_c0_seq1.p1 gnl/MRDRNA2_/MRDRNA2_57359_c0~~gnl/MRDRNA2_/MRDRNA2_57359_c0_seq1.p1  ORF type:complete len:283 (+),score=31.40 gnl/MRDRNA2_/MRDRNA2_57359_c0_seq1:99-947(+)
MSFFIPSALVANPSPPSNQILARSFSSGSSFKPIPSGEVTGPRCILVDSEALVPERLLSSVSPSAKPKPIGTKLRIPSLDFSCVDAGKPLKIGKSLETAADQGLKNPRDDQSIVSSRSAHSLSSLATCRSHEANEGEYQIPYWAPPSKQASPSQSHRSSRSYRSSRSHRSSNSSTLKPLIMSMSRPIHLGSAFPDTAPMLEVDCDKTRERDLSIKANDGAAGIQCKVWENDREFVTAVAATSLLQNGMPDYQSHRPITLDEEQAKVVEQRVNAIVDEFTGFF